MAFVFDPGLLTAIIFLTTFVPGIAIAYPLLRKENLHIIELCLYAVAIGFVVLPLLLFLEFFVLGIGFSLPLVYANIALIVIAGIAWAWRDGAFAELSFKMPEIKLTFESAKNFVSAHGAQIAILRIFLLAFWMRTLSYSPIYAELDPYYYIYGTKQILTEGGVPPTDDTGWYPVVRGTHRNAPLVNYNEAVWYSFYTNGGEYYNYLLSTVAGFYPPLAGALMAFFVYVLVSVEYGKRMGVVAAALASLLPITMLKFAAGVSEIQAYNFFAIFFMFGTYAYALARPHDKRRMALVCIAIVSMLLGSNANQIFVLVLPPFIALHSLLLLYTGKRKELEDFFWLNVAVSATAIVSRSILFIYQGGFEIPIQELAALGTTLVFAGFPHFFEQVKEEDKRKQILGAVAVAVLLVLVATPVPGKFLEAAKGAVSTVVYSTALYKTIAEQSGAGDSFEGEAGALSATLNRGIEGELAKVATGTVNVALASVDLVLNSVFNLNTKTSQKANSVGMVIMFGAMVAAALALARTVGARHHRALAISTTFLLMLLLIFPVSYVGMNRSKYTIYYAVMLALALSFVLGEAAVWLRYAVRYFARGGGWISHNKGLLLSAAAWFVFLIGAVAVVAEAHFENYPIGEGLLLQGYKVRYQDSPAQVAPKMTEICDRLRLSGRYDSGICLAAQQDPQLLSSINSQFDSTLCYISLVSDPFSQPPAVEQVAGSYRCSRLSPYWVETMEWISKNTGEQDKITSWWDYGHWINFFGNRDTVLRNEHASTKMIGMVAEAYIDGSPEKLAEYMGYFNSKYALFDNELVDAGPTFGGKYGALNYLACAYMNQTSVAQSPGESRCEFEHMWENIFVPISQLSQKPCTISESQNIQGIVGYVADPSSASAGNLAEKYCIGPAALAGGGRLENAAYFLDRRGEDGNLVLNKADLTGPLGANADFAYFTSRYTAEKKWPGPNGTAVSGWEDAPTKFYRSNLYRGYFLKELPGFRLVFESAGGEVKIYELEGFETRETHQSGRT